MVIDALDKSGRAILIRDKVYDTVDNHEGFVNYNFHYSSANELLR